MTDFLPGFLTGYLIIISIITVIVTVYDKIAAKKNPRGRVPEKTLMLLGLFGGAAAEFITMQIIRHKTRHNKFMLGLPAFIILHIIVFILIKRYI